MKQAIAYSLLENKSIPQMVSQVNSAMVRMYRSVLDSIIKQTGGNANEVTIEKRGDDLSDYVMLNGEEVGKIDFQQSYDIVNGHRMTVTFTPKIK